MEDVEPIPRSDQVVRQKILKFEYYQLWILKRERSELELSVKVKHDNRLFFDQVHVTVLGYRVGYRLVFVCNSKAVKVMSRISLIMLW